MNAGAGKVYVEYHSDNFCFRFVDFQIPVFIFTVSVARLYVWRDYPPSAYADKIEMMNSDPASLLLMFSSSNCTATWASFSSRSARIVSSVFLPKREIAFCQNEIKLSGAGLREYLQQCTFLIVDFKGDLPVHVYAEVEVGHFYLFQLVR